jgi:carboxyl-terminal processing protease
VFPISENTGLALTTFHYYTPSGRLIQRNYNNVSLYDYYYVRDSATAPKDNANREVKLTDSGRTVYGGGGITPDEKIENLKSNKTQDTLVIAYAFMNFSKHYLATHTIEKTMQVDDAMLQQFKDFLHKEKVEVSDADLATNVDWIKARIKSELFTSQFGQIEGTRILAESDPQINKALTFMPEAQALEDHTLPSQQKTQTAAR